MVEHIKGDIFATDAQVILHGCNCQGVMGAGVALAIAQKWPNAFYDYKTYLEDIYDNREEPHPKEALGNIIPVRVSDDKIVINGLTQLVYGREPGRCYLDYYALSSVFTKTLKWMKTAGLTSLAMPRIGCGLAGGDWEKVSQSIDSHFKYEDLDVKVYYL